MSLDAVFEQVRLLMRQRPYPVLLAVPKEVAQPLRDHSSRPANTVVLEHMQVLQGVSTTPSPVRNLVIVPPWRDDDRAIEMTQALTWAASGAVFDRTLASVRWDLREGMVRRIQGAVYGDKQRTRRTDLKIVLLTDELLMLDDPPP